LQVAGGARTAPFSLSNLISFPFDTTIAACHLIFGGVLDRHPKLRFTLPHGGGVLLMLMGRIDHGATVRPEIEKLQLPRPPSKYLDRFMYDTVVHSKSVMEFVISEVGADRIMIGSDYCLDMGYEQPVHFLDQVNMTSAQKKMILGENAARLLKL
jgi:aminocarboxymuconate-semialdehyde decarboxylase